MLSRLETGVVSASLETIGALAGVLGVTVSLSRYPSRVFDKSAYRTKLGTRFAKRPIEFAIRITIAGMSSGALSANVKEALGRSASETGTSPTTGECGMTPEERRSSTILVYQCLPSRYGFNPGDVRKADAVEVVIGQGASLAVNASRAEANSAGCCDAHASCINGWDYRQLGTAPGACHHCQLPDATRPASPRRIQCLSRG
jgi:hypothetical protein